jgi:hypothetical protein
MSELLDDDPQAERTVAEMSAAAMAERKDRKDTRAPDKVTIKSESTFNHDE